ncbi:MAG: hypothetical protein JWQ00_2321, partial [Noviherbaspirillum sp.]|nr:hypothetical protein [Noviherbaspirillum sp.]
RPVLNGRLLSPDSMDEPHEAAELLG